ncbi:unnamed protein product [Candida verbasci]|uniref:Amidase domain-containing protein n=1 Tax=Candida verbasci TaxID=1227364 RepID=A0A9W4U1I1_9ASCO|nr:unnamed protein product [Candida verbasci]
MSSQEAIFNSFLTKETFEGFEDNERYTKEWLPKVEKYRQALADSIPDSCKAPLPKPIDELINEQFNAMDYMYSAKLLTDDEFKITDTPAYKLVEQMSKGELTAVEVYRAFAHRAIIAHQFTNCAMEFFFHEGLQQAEERDAYFRETGKIVGPLHGLPFSLKEHMDYKGKITHAGYVSMIDNIPEEHGVTVDILQKLGAVYYVRTNEPQTLMHLDSNNNYTGLTKCPFNLLLSAGGSSSGEGAISAFGGAALGIGSDIGGSIRSPAAFSGTLGLRTSTRRVSDIGSVSAFGGFETVPCVMGPFARCVEDIDYWMKSYLNEGKPWERDGWVLPMPWRQVAKPAPKDLTIAVTRDDGLVRVSPPIRRAINEVVEKLKAAGVKIVEFQPPNTKLAYETLNKAYNCDGNLISKEFLSASGEPLVKLTKWNLNFGDGAKQYTIGENRQLNIIRDKLRTEYTRYLVDNKIDFILSPTYNNVAPHSEEIYNWSYTGLYNILDFPTLVFQSGVFQDPNVDRWTEEDLKYEYRSDLEKLENENYKPDEFIGAPVGLQLTGRRYFDEEIVAAGKTIVDDILKVDLFKH